MTRYRCGACGNLTRFDVTATRTTRAFHHYSLGGSLAVEDEEVLDEVVTDVSCRWCGNGRSVEILPAEATEVRTPSPTEVRSRRATEVVPPGVATQA